MAEEKDLKARIEALAPAPKDGQSPKTVGIWARKAELQGALEGAASEKDDHAGRIALLAAAVQQPVYTEKDGRKVKTEEIVKGEDGIKSLIADFGGDGSGLRRLQLDKEHLIKAADGGGKAAKAVEGVIAESETRGAKLEQDAKARRDAKKESGKEAGAER